MQRVLLLNENIKDSQLLKKTFRNYYPATEIVKARDSVGGLDILLRERVDTIFIDYVFSLTDIDFLGEVQKNNISAPVIVIIEKGKEILAAEAIKKGACDYIIKDASYPDSLPDVIERTRSASILKKNAEEKREQRSILFKQIYKSHKWWQNIIDAITDYLFVIDDDYKILRTNKAFANLFGREPADIIMKPYFELFDLKSPHEWCVLPKDKDSFCHRYIERKINESIYLISCFPIFFDNHDAAVYIMKDITETRRLKDQVYHLDKLSSLGTLTSGVAHEINNPLTGIIGYTEMLLMKNEGELSKKYLQNIYDSAIRCKRIVENMLAFSRQAPVCKNLENINDIIDKTIELHEYWLKTTNIEIIKDYEDALYTHIDRQQMQQIILNLMINAEHAISETDRSGRIEFKTAYDKKSSNIIITVSDNGNGIPREALPKIFDPFFTTKPVNKGTGLGLSIAHGIIAEQGGTIEAESKIGNGTSFIIKLPRTD
jgi:PAS domain S-box-containing protein